MDFSDLLIWFTELSESVHMMHMSVCFIIATYVFYCFSDCRQYVASVDQPVDMFDDAGDEGACNSSIVFRAIYEDLKVICMSVEMLQGECSHVFD